MPLKRAVLVDRDPLLLSKLTGEMSQSGFIVESLSSGVGLTPDLLELSSPDFLLLDAELPGVKYPPAFMVIIRSLKSRQPVTIAVSTSHDPKGVTFQLVPDRVIPRAQLLAEGARAFGIELSPESKVDVREIIDEVLGQKCVGEMQTLRVKLDLFSKGNFYVGRDDQLGVFIPTVVLLPVGQKVEIQLELMDQPAFTLTGNVAWQRSPGAFGGRVVSGIGVKPIEIPAPHSQDIDHFVKTRQPITWAA